MIHNQRKLFKVYCTERDSNREAFLLIFQRQVNKLITPSSNYLLGRVADLRTHPIAKLYRSGIDVIINSDDVLIFDSDVSKEYLRLYQCGCLTAEELDVIRKNGLKSL